MDITFSIDVSREALVKTIVQTIEGMETATDKEIEDWIKARAEENMSAYFAGLNREIELDKLDLPTASEILKATP